MKVDELDAKIVALFSADPDAGVLAASRQLGVARPTVQARLDKLKKAGIIEHVTLILNPSRFGFPVMAFVSVEISQNVGHISVRKTLEVIPEIVEMYTVSGDHDVLIRIVAASNQDLQRVLDSILQTGAVTRTGSTIVLQTHFQNRLLPLFTRVGLETDDT